MTDFQVLQQLKAAGVVGVRKEEGSTRLILVQRSKEGESEIPLGRYKTDLQSGIKQLEEEKKEVQRNFFAGRQAVEFSLPGGGPMKMEALKSDSQLSAQERSEKSGRLAALDTEAKKRRSLLMALAHLQVNIKELLPKLNPPSPLSAPVSRDSGGKTLWTRGMKAAALFCLAEGKKIKADDAALLALCRAFLDRYAVEEEDGYSAEQLFNNVRQIRQLDALD
jgi:hypothetical protein